jgi:hypothetical protein
MRTKSQREMGRGGTYKMKMICLQGIFPLSASGQSQVGVGPIWIVWISASPLLAVWGSLHRRFQLIRAAY